MVYIRAVSKTIFIRMAVPAPIIASWLFGGFINLLVMGAVLAFVYEKVK